MIWYGWILTCHKSVFNCFLLGENKNYFYKKIFFYNFNELSVWIRSWSIKKILILSDLCFLFLFIYSSKWTRRFCKKSSPWKKILLHIAHQKPGSVYTLCNFDTMNNYARMKVVNRKWVENIFFYGVKVSFLTLVMVGGGAQSAPPPYFYLWKQ